MTAGDQPQDEWSSLRASLRDRGIQGVDDLGRFVSNTEHFEPSAFDERAALAGLIEALPHLSDRGLVNAVAGHLRRPWARPTAFDALHEAFIRWAPADEQTGWAVGDSLVSAAEAVHLPKLLSLVEDRRYGMARQMIVYSLYRFKASPRVEAVLWDLVHEETVGLHAMSALQRTIGAERAISVFAEVADRHPDTSLGQQARRKLLAAQRSTGRRS